MRNITKIIFSILILALLPLGYKAGQRMLHSYNKKQYKIIATNVLKNYNLNKTGFTTKKVKFSSEGIENIALISMIKDEDDIIYENLVWHFCIGFRKFVLIDNNSTDNTRRLIEKFKNETLGKATVIIIEDPILEYIQSRITTGAMQFAHSTWPEVTWVFPVDGDEFWYPNAPLKDILSSIPDDKNVILTLQYDHMLTEKADKFNHDLPFYEAILYRNKTLSGGMGKIALKADADLIIAQGNHNAITTERTQGLRYISGNLIGLDMRHFQRRSLAQVQKKYWNGAQANIAAQNKKLISLAHGSHWSSFMTEVNEKGLNKATEDRFNEHVAPKENCVADPLPMEEAFKLYHELIREE
jgi:hypothetical protein